MNQSDLFPDSDPDRDNKKRARSARDQGIKRAIDNADRHCADWSDRAFSLVQPYLMRKAGEKITGEEVRQYVERMGLPNPPDKRSWGAIMLRAAKKGLLQKVGWTTASDPKVRCNPISLWVVTPFNQPPSP